MPAYHVARSILINKPLGEVMDVLKDFHQWPLWSPWLIMEPEATLEYSGTPGEPGAAYSWSGKLVGSGNMQLEAVTDDHLDMQLAFIKPFKSVAQVSFDLENDTELTRVTWNMSGHFPFYMYPLTKKMQAWIGMDYDRGLTMLKDYLETGTVDSQILIDGISSIQPQHYVGLKSECHISEIHEAMKSDFASLYDLLTDQKWSKEVIPFSIHHKMNRVSGIISFTCAIPVLNDINVKKPFITGKLRKSRALRVTHTGRYDHLGNAWSTTMAVTRYQQLKTQKQFLGIERYMNDPATTPAEELVTDVLVPLRN